MITILIAAAAVLLGMFSYRAGFYVCSHSKKEKEFPANHKVGGEYSEMIDFEFEELMRFDGENNKNS